MKQVMQDLRTGQTRVAEMANPPVSRGRILIRTSRTLISAGTERSLKEFGRANYIEKARQQPEKVKLVLEKVRTDGLLPTISAVQEQLDRALPMGYCNTGTVIAIGEGVTGFKLGDRVASNGHHAEVVSVPANLCALIPDEVSDDEAVFTVISSVALQGVRLIEPTLGESVAVFGLGLVGLLAVQLLRCHGARVLAFDMNRERVNRAKDLGVSAIDLETGVNPIDSARAFTKEVGVDGVLICASTKSSELIHQAAEMSRQRGRIVLTGVVGLELRRSDFYEKELSFRVSCSYGPGRYDPSYEEEGSDYPVGFVRWTEQRNFEAILQLLRDDSLKVDELISARFPISEADKAYDLIGENSTIGVLLEYPEAVRNRSVPRTFRLSVPHKAKPSTNAICGLIGTGSFAQATLVPALKKANASLKWVVSAYGASGAEAARRFDIPNTSTQVDDVLADPEVNFVVIATKHDSHASLAARALEAGKSVYVEKPLCINSEELHALETTYSRAISGGSSTPPILMVGFNRRFAPLTAQLMNRLEDRQRSLCMVFTCNAGSINSEHWVHDPYVGGGRIIGEACHFVDLLQFISRAPIIRAYARAAQDASSAPLPDCVGACLEFADGSVGLINYFANGTKKYPKETLEVYTQQRVFRLENFRRLRAFGTLPVPKTSRQDKGHEACVAAFVESVRKGSPSPIPFDQLVNSTSATIGLVQCLMDGQAIEIGRRSDGIAVD